MNNLEIAKNNFLKAEEILSPYATKSSEAIRLREEKNDIRPAFFHDIDRMIHALSYTRYIDKTQVYSFKENDHISKRMVHVQLVSKIARTIGRALLLNIDLIEAIALGHDIGHTPLGHAGEKMLNEISRKEQKENFSHNIQSVRNYMYIENKGEGLNLSIQVLDGIMCHNGEILSNEYKPKKKTKEEFLKEYQESYQNRKKSQINTPMTLEGCVVRISDMIAYIGRDIEDAINLGLFNRKDLPKEIVNVLGNNNKEIVNTIILDIIENSLNKPYIKMSKKVYDALFALKQFNNQYIYSKSMTKKEREYYKVGMNKIFNRYLKDVEEENQNSIIFKIFLKDQNKKYQQETPPKRIVIDFIAGMTDDLFRKEIKELEKLEKK